MLQNSRKVHNLNLLNTQLSVNVSSTKFLFKTETVTNHNKAVSRLKYHNIMTHILKVIVSNRTESTLAFKTIPVSIQKSSVAYLLPLGHTSQEQYNMNGQAHANGTTTNQAAVKDSTYSADVTVPSFLFVISTHALMVNCFISRSHFMQTLVTLISCICLIVSLILRK